MMKKQYEVIILGSGISGSLLATVLAKNNVSVCMLDSEVHPRFAIGESTVPETTLNLKIMSKLYDVPEIANFSNFFELRDRVGSSHGFKKGFSFCYHRENENHHPLESTQTSTLSPPLGPDAHWFRQDTDQYMIGVAASYGVDIIQGTKIEDVDMANDGVNVTTCKGIFKGEFLVDSSGARSLAAKKLGIRDSETPYDTHSRGFFNHMVGVGEWEDISPKEGHKMPYRMDQTTLHHLFDGGWIWIIPFNNHDQATNNLCSVGVMLDSRKWPKTDLSPEAEFNKILDHFPDIKRQFQSATAVRKWVGSSRIQYSSHSHLSNRYFAMPATAAFVDPLFSSGLVLATHVVNVLGETLINSFKKGQLDVEKLQSLEQQIIKKNQRYDKLVNSAYKSFQSFELWNAWFRVWEISTYFNTLGGIRCLLKYESTKNLDDLRARYQLPYSKPLGFGIEGFEVLFNEACTAVDLVDSGDLNVNQGTKKIYRALDKFDAMPYFLTRRDEKERTIGTFTLFRLIHMVLWAKWFGPKSTAQYYDFTMFSYVKVMFKHTSKFMVRHTGVAWQTIRLMLFSHNKKMKFKLSPQALSERHQADHRTLFVPYTLPAVKSNMVDSSNVQDAENVIMEKKERAKVAQ